MKERLKKLIGSENIKNPYTDGQLANLLNLRRDEVTGLRAELNILNSRQRLKPILLREIKKIISMNPEISIRQLTGYIKDQGFNVSRYLVADLSKESNADMQDFIVLKNNNETLVKNTHKEEDINIFNPSSRTTEYFSDVSSFKEIIGYNDSLKPQIQQAKAAILYPPHGLHTLIIGPTGVGKSNLAEAMYGFALEIGSLTDNGPFVVFNCADYADNPHLLLSQLFGHAKNAFTGAVTAKEGLVEKADGGILFLDEVHRLPSEGQELLYSLMDKGKFRRLGETDAERIVKVMIIAATTEDIESTLLLTFRRRIPVIIELPTLASRPLDERYQIIRKFFNIEANRIGFKVKVTQEALRALLIYNCKGNIGQLRSDIQVACARGFLTFVSNQRKYVEVGLLDLPLYVKQELLKIQDRKPQVESLLKGELIVTPGQINAKAEPKEDLYTLPKEIYQYIEERYQQLETQGMSKDDINQILGGELEAEFNKLIEQVESIRQNFDKKDLIGIVGVKIIDMTEKVMKIAEKRLGKADNSLFYCLAIHLSETIERIQQRRPIINPNIEKVKNEYKLEYEVAKEIVKYIEELLEMTIPKDEIGFIAMYLRIITKPIDIKRGRVGIIVLSHGSVALGMVEVANKLLKVDHAVGIEMRLDEQPESTLQRTIKIVKEIDEGKGVLVLVDMGSLITFGEIITKETGIPTRTVDRVDTVMVLEAVRRAILPDTNLDEIVRSIDKDKVGLGRYLFPNSNNKNRKVILTLCITGEGSAIRMKKLIKKMIPEFEEEFEIIPMGIIGDKDISIKIDRIKNDREIALIVGTIDPKYDTSIPFVTLEEIINGSAEEKIRYILNLKSNLKINTEHHSNLISLSEIIHENLIVINPDYNIKSDAIDNLSHLLIEGGYVNENFLIDIYKREANGPTLINEIVAIPHGNPENVIKPAIALCLFKKPIIWWAEKEVEIVFLLALKKESKEIISNVYKIIEDTDLLYKIRQFDNPTDVKNALFEKFLSFN